MKELNLKAKAARCFKVTTDSNHKNPVGPIILGQRLSPPAAKVPLAAEITYVRTDEGWLYLATLTDLYSRKIIGLNMNTQLVSKLVINALSMVINQWKPPQEVIYHSDRGSQYCSDVY